MTDKEYAARLLEIRVKVNTLLDDMGATYSTRVEMLEKVLNVAMNGDLSKVKAGKVKTSKFITVRDCRRVEYRKPEIYI
jgi:hypothetical protein